MVAAFCSHMGWSDLELLVTKFQGVACLYRQGPRSFLRGFKDF